MVDRLAIARLGQRGDGIADTADGPVYVPYTLPGETVETESWPGHPDRRHLVRMDVPSPERIAPICPHFGVCGGCALQHWRAPRYGAWKRDLVVAALSYAGLDATVDDIVDAHGEGRRRAVFHARRGTKEILQVGFAAASSHHIVPIDHCPILAPGLGGALEAAWAIAETLGATAKPLDIQATATDAGLDIDVRGSGPLTTPQSIALARLADDRGLARLTRHGELVARRATPTVRMGRAVVRGPEPRTSMSRPASLAVAWMSSGLAVAPSVSAIAQAASSAPPRPGARIGQWSIATMWWLLAAANPTWRMSLVPRRAWKTARRRPSPWASTMASTVASSSA